MSSTFFSAWPIALLWQKPGSEEGARLALGRGQRSAGDEFSWRGQLLFENCRNLLRELHKPLGERVIEIKGLKGTGAYIG